MRRLAYEREVLRRRHLKKREIWRFLTLVHSKQIVLDERPIHSVEDELRARGFATNSDLSLAFAGEGEDLNEGPSESESESNPFKYLLDLPRSLSLSEKWRRLEQEVEQLMAQYVAKLATTVWDEWTRDLSELRAAVEQAMSASTRLGTTSEQTDKKAKAPKTNRKQAAKKIRE